jgi:hypothetical protein
MLVAVLEKQLGMASSGEATVATTAAWLEPLRAKACRLEEALEKEKGSLGMALEERTAMQSVQSLC